MKKITPEYQIVIVPRGSLLRSRLWWAVAALLWGLSLGATWLWSGQTAAPRMAEYGERARAAESQLQALREQVRDLGQRDATLSRSDQITRQANADLQATLAQRDEEIASLRADVAFFERLVGPTAQRQGLNVFSSEFDHAAGTAWNYRVVLVQNRDRNAISNGHMRFVVEGLQDGRLATLDWAQLQQKPGAPEQPYSFR